MRKGKKARKGRGFGLVETLVAGFIGALLMFGIARMIKLSGDGQHRADMKYDLQNFETRLRNLPSDPDSCKTAFIDQLPNRIFDPTNLGATMIQSGAAYQVVKLISIIIGAFVRHVRFSRRHPP